MKLPFSLALLLANLTPLGAQTAGNTSTEQDARVTKWDVSFPIVATSEQITEQLAPEILKFESPVTSKTFIRHVTEAPPMEGLPPVSGDIRVTFEVVKPPKNYAPPLPPLPPAENVAAAVVEGEQALTKKRETRHATNLIFISATVYDAQRTLIRIYSNGSGGQDVEAWSNIDFNLFRGVTGYELHKSDGSIENCSLLMGIGDFPMEAAQKLSKKLGRKYSPPDIPALPELATKGPSFQLVSGDSTGPAMESLEQLHDLFRREGERMKTEYAARKQADAERRAELLVNPPKPENIVIRYWKGKSDPNGKEGGK